MRAATRQGRLALHTNLATGSRPQVTYRSIEHQRRCVGVNAGAAGPGGGEGHPEPGMWDFIGLTPACLYKCSCTFMPLGQDRIAMPFESWISIKLILRRSSVDLGYQYFFMLHSAMTMCDSHCCCITHVVATWPKHILTNI